MKRKKRQWIAKFLVVAMIVTLLPLGVTKESKAEYYNNGGCVRWVKDRASSKLGIQLPATGKNKYGLCGANNYWYTLNYPKGSEPRENALAVWEYGFQGTKYGHVAFVESVNGNSVTFSEGGYYRDVVFLGNHYVNCGTTSKQGMKTVSGCSGFLGYIYLTGQSPVIQIPNSPGGISLNATDFGKGDVLTASWSPVNGATGYHVSLISSSGTQNKSVDVGGTSASFQLSSAETYRVDVSAFNSAGSSGYSKSQNCNVHNDITVKYVDWENKLVSLQTVKWGGTSTAPVPPEREGYTFQKWSSDGKGLKADTTISAEYKINTYSVSFVDYKGEVIGKVQKVEYMKSADEPSVEDIPCRKGYIFNGWNTDEYKSVKKNLTLKATYVWENTDLPIVSEITSAKRNEAGTSYIVDVDMWNFPDDFTKGKIVVSLLTKSGKMVASETRTISMPEDGKISEKITVLYSGVASTAEVSMIGVLDDETTGTPKSKLVSRVIDQDKEWSDWGTTVPEGDDLITESRTEYRYKDSKMIKSASQPSAPVGYTLQEVTNTGTYTEWGPWSGWLGYAIGSNALTDVQTQDGYRVYAFVCDHCGRRDPLGGPCSRCGASLRWDQITDTVSGYTRGYLNTDESGARMSTIGRVIINNVTWYFELNGKSNGEPQSRSVSGNGYGQVIYPLWRYRSRQEYKNYLFWQNDYSDWQVDEVTESSTRQLETRTTYRFKSNTTEIPCYNYKRYKYTNTNSGKVVYSYTSKYADSMDYPGEWEYSKTYTEYEKEATVEDDIDIFNGIGEESWYRADINDESTSTVYKTMDTLEDKNGVSRTVEGDVENLSGKVATLLVYKGNNEDPTASQIEYIGQTQIDEKGHYKFDFITKEEPTALTGDFVVTLGIEGATNYQVIDRIEAPKKVYSVEFVDDEGNNIGETKKVADGGTVDAPKAPEKEGFEFIGWDTGLKNVHDNMVVTAQYKKKKCMVVFVDYDNTSVAVKEFDYGDVLNSDTIPTRAGMKFDKWIDSNKEEVTTVTENMIVEASYREAVYTVVYKDWDGNIISEQTLKYGEDAKAPSELEAPSSNMVFAGWSRGIEYITSDTVITPVSKYVDDSKVPQFSVDDGSDEKKQRISLFSLSGNTNIFYKVLTLDEEEEKCGYIAPDEFEEYEDSIEINQNSVIYAYAETKDKNPSDVIRKEFTILGDDSNPTVSPSPTLEPKYTAIPTSKPTSTIVNPIKKSESVSTKKVIKLGKVKIVSAKNNKKKTVTIKIKTLKNAKKYELDYATKKSFKNAKTKTTSKINIAIKKLKKKAYYIRVRGINGNVFGAWSSVKKVKVVK